MLERRRLAERFEFVVEPRREHTNMSAGARQRLDAPRRRAAAADHRGALAGEVEKDRQGLHRRSAFGARARRPPRERGTSPKRPGPASGLSPSPRAGGQAAD